MSLFVMYFGTDRRYEDVAHHEILMGPRYRELLDDIFTRKTLADDFSLYLHRPTATDPSLAPAGCDSWYVLSPVPQIGSAGTAMVPGNSPPQRSCRAASGSSAETRRSSASLTPRSSWPSSQ